MSGNALARQTGVIGGPQTDPTLPSQTSGANAQNIRTLLAKKGSRVRVKRLILFASAPATATLVVQDSGATFVNYGTLTLNVQAIVLECDFFASLGLVDASTVGQIDIVVGAAGGAVTTTLSVVWEYVAP